MNPLPPEHQPSSSKSKRRRQPNDGNTAKKSLFGGYYVICQERMLPREWTRRPSILASSPASAAEETESCDRDGDSDGAGEWRPWADIATPLLDVLLPRVSLLDRVLISSVCRPWRDFLTAHPSLRRPRLPWLMIQNEEESVRDFCSPSDDGYYALHLTDTKNKLCIAASHGWLLFSDRQHVRGFLVNPLSKACVDLPPCPQHFKCAALSAAPTEPGCVVLGLSLVRPGTWNIYYCPIGDKTWHVGGARFVLKSNIAVMGGKFYFLCEEGLAEMDCGRGRPLKWLKLNDKMLPCWDTCRRYFPETDYDYHWLVESNGELLVVTLLRSPAPGEGIAAYVLRAGFANMTWDKVEDLSGRSLFLSRGACFSLPAVDVSEHVRGCVCISDRHTKDIYCVYRSPLWQEDMACPGRGWGSLDGYIMGCRSWEAVWLMPTV